MAKYQWLRNLLVSWTAKRSASVKQLFLRRASSVISASAQSVRNSTIRGSNDSDVYTQRNGNEHCNKLTDLTHFTVDWTKTKVMCISRKRTSNMKILIDGEIVKSF